MTEEHPNAPLLKRRDVPNLAVAKDRIAEDVVWHNVKPNRPELECGCVGLEGIRSLQADFRLVVNRA